MADAALSCAQCSAQLSIHPRAGRPRIYCSECRPPLTKPDPQGPCASCGAAIVGRKRRYCGASCRQAAITKRVRKKHDREPRWADGTPESHKVFRCYVCESSFSPKRAGRTKCCSRACGFVWQRERKAILKRATFRVWRPRARTAVPEVRHCPSCLVVELKPRAQRCDECREKHKAAMAVVAKERNRASGAKAARRKARKLKLRGVTVQVVNPIKVLARDRWTCQLCGVKTPKKLRGTYDDRAPEVDHIIPIAEGGEHSYLNTQCACRRCNIAKGSKLLGQLRLFG